MNTKKLISVILAALMALTLFAACGKPESTDKDSAEVTGTVSTDGSTSMEKVIMSLGKSFQTEHKGITVGYNPTGSGSGITAVSDGRCDIGLAYRALKADEKASGLKETTLTLDGIAIIVSPENKVSDLTIEQIAKIFTGEITNRKDVGGADAEIVLIGREAGSGTLGKQSGKGKHQLTLAVARIALQKRDLAEGNIGIPQPAHLFRGNLACLDDFQFCV